MFRYFGGLAMGDSGMFRYFRYYGYFGFAAGDRSIQPYFLGKVILQWMSCRRMRTSSTYAGLVGHGLEAVRESPSPLGEGPGEAPSPSGRGPWRSLPLPSGRGPG